MLRVEDHEMKMSTITWHIVFLIQEIQESNMITGPEHANNRRGAQELKVEVGSKRAKGWEQENRGWEAGP